MQNNKNLPRNVPSGNTITTGNIQGQGIAIGPYAKSEVNYYEIHHHHDGTQKSKMPYQAPALPPKFLPNDDALFLLKQRMLNPAVNGRTLALYGMGGLGKTTTAIALCRDTQIMESFPDGILWATLGPQGDPLAAQASWGHDLGADLTNIPTAIDRATSLRSLLFGKRCLIILDDIWDARHLAPLQVGGTQSVTLVTTREYGIAQKAGDALSLDILSPEQALNLLEK